MKRRPRGMTTKVGGVVGTKHRQKDKRLASLEEVRQKDIHCTCMLSDRRRKCPKHGANEEEVKDA